MDIEIKVRRGLNDACIILKPWGNLFPLFGSVLTSGAEFSISCRKQTTLQYGSLLRLSAYKSAREKSASGPWQGIYPSIIDSRGCKRRRLYIPNTSAACIANWSACEVICLTHTVRYIISLQYRFMFDYQGEPLLLYSNRSPNIRGVTSNHGALRQSLQGGSTIILANRPSQTVTRDGSAGVTGGNGARLVIWDLIVVK